MPLTAKLVVSLLSYAPLSMQSRQTLKFLFLSCYVSSHLSLAMGQLDAATAEDAQGG